MSIQFGRGPLAPGNTVFVTGGAGFIGSHLVKQLLGRTQVKVVNIDCLTYAGNLESLSSVFEHERFEHQTVDVCDEHSIPLLLESHRPSAVFHLAAESHVDRSIADPGAFVRTNVMGTFNLLHACEQFLAKASNSTRQSFRFLHVSTDEVYGELGDDGLFTESTPYNPSSPYSASKASSDHFVRAWSRTFGLPAVITNCSNNYGPFQYPEKLIPVVIDRARRGEPIPVYGTGKNVRDWLYVEDHVAALMTVIQKGIPGQTYNIGGCNEIANLEVVRTVCHLLDEEVPSQAPHERLITFVEDRKGHDWRYAIDASKIEWELEWVPVESFESGIRKTVDWYLKNDDWSSEIRRKMRDNTTDA